MQLQLSNAAIEAVRKSHQCAQRLGHDYVGTEHLLQGVLSVASRDEALQYIVSCFGLTAEKVEETILAHTGTGTCFGKAYRRDTGRLAKVFQEADDEAYRRGAQYVRPRHILVALIPASRHEHDEAPSEAGIMLAELGMTFDTARRDVVDKLVRHELSSYEFALTDD